MIDPVLVALREYEQEVAPAYEVIRRAQQRVMERLGTSAGAPNPAIVAWARIADPTEPNGADFLLEPAAIESTEPRPAGAREVEPEAAVVPPGGAPPVTDQPEQGQGVPDASPAPAPLVACPDCGKEVRSQGLGTHRRQAHSARATTLTQGPVAVDPPKSGDGRRIDQDCPNGCGRHFAWKPALASHLKHCTGPGEAEEPVQLPVAESWTPRPEAIGSSGPVQYGSRQRWLCDRCSAPFPSQDSRDRHQATHPPIPELRPVGSRAQRGDIDRALHGGA